MKLKAFKGLGEIKSRENRVWKGFGSRTRLRLGHERGKKKSRALPCGAWLPAAERRGREGMRARAGQLGRSGELAGPPGQQGGFPLSFFFQFLFCLLFQNLFPNSILKAQTNKIKTGTITHTKKILCSSMNARFKFFLNL